MTVGAAGGFLLIAAAAAYVQTLTGFALGLLVMGAVGLTGVVPLPVAAVIVSIMTLVNAAQVLARGWRNVAGRHLRLILLAALPGVALGYGLLTVMAASRQDALRILLGAVIGAAAVQLAGSAARRTMASPPGAALGFGLLGGLMSGLFSTAGPPIVFYMYRQPLTFPQVRETLVTIFAINATVRLALVGATGHLTAGTLGLAALAAPGVVAATFAARRWPPPLSPTALRSTVVGLLALSGIALAAPALARLLFPG